MKNILKISLFIVILLGLFAMSVELIGSSLNPFVKMTFIATSINFVLDFGEKLFK